MRRSALVLCAAALVAGVGVGVGATSAHGTATHPPLGTVAGGNWPIQPVSPVPGEH